MKIHPDFSEFIGAMNHRKVQFLIVGAFDLAFLGSPRYTGDLDVWVRPTESNARLTLKAIEDFGFKSLDLTSGDILSGKIIQMGFAPVRIDVITVLDGLAAEEIWASRTEGILGDHRVLYLGRNAFVKNKRAAGRTRDLADLEALGELPQSESGAQ